MNRETTPPHALMWFRDDLRLQDNQALTWLSDWCRGQAGEPEGRGPGEKSPQKPTLLALFIHEDPAATGIRAPGQAAHFWQQRSLASLREALVDHGVPLIEAHGDPTVIIPDLVARNNIQAVAWNRRYHQPAIAVDAQVKNALASQDTQATQDTQISQANHTPPEVHSFPGYLLTEPWAVTTTTGTPYKVFTPFGKAAFQYVQEHFADPLPALRLPGPGVNHHIEMGEWGGGGGVANKEEPTWAAAMLNHHEPGEQGAQLRLNALDLRGYTEQRDFPAYEATSNLSAHLRFGEVSPAQVWARAADIAEEHPEQAEEVDAFLRQLLWRDFAWHRLYHLPNLATDNVRQQFNNFPWAWPDSNPQAAADVRAWQRGQTGIAIVDAGMRELWATGTMHNRVRMIVGSLLTKNLGVHWRVGEEWFWDTLVDADHASNPFNWQWVAGCGDDASPYFRIFNPVTQQKRFDPDGHYVARWVPEGARNSAPIVDLKQSRAAALEAYELMKATAP
ncbi:MAG TPA: DNA photolyase family protein [Candidatus Corynebacterium gallistercoris]|uniref:DNA photolyase family protein n=1 Tax=Candidatus Corynebacterium gallistercoris TaxID=2838530 RepID=A0A9D1RYI6_9CORY|nr:DNA photolyase family protein [Candidatus Corynebacterium gallistercoris]